VRETRQQRVTRRVTFAGLLGEELKRVRKLHLVNQEEVAQAVGVHQGHFSRLERGTSVPDVEQLLRWCDALGVDMGDVVSSVLKQWHHLVAALSDSR
jgi:transcriptional regulator with XRE-family HTH domain